MSVIFYQIFIFHQIIALQKLWQTFFISSKKPFPSWDIQLFVNSSSPLFFPFSHCFRGWFKKNLKVYDVINCLNKNLTTHYVWYLENKIRRDIETLSIDRVVNKEPFLWKNHAENVHQKLASDSFSILLNDPKQPLHARNSF